MSTPATRGNYAMAGILGGARAEERAAAGSSSRGVGIEVLSSFPELVTGGDALVKITGARAAPHVTVGGERCFGRLRGGC